MLNGKNQIFSGLHAITMQGDNVFINNPLFKVETSSNAQHNYQQDNVMKRKGYIEWKLVNDLQYDELQEEKERGNVLSWLIRHEEYDSATLWIEHLPSIDTVDVNGYTPLQLACTKSNVAFVKSLLELHSTKKEYIDQRDESTSVGPDVNLQNKQGNTALHIAIMNGHLEIAALLLNFECDITIKNKVSRFKVYLFYFIIQTNICLIL